MKRLIVVGFACLCAMSGCMTTTGAPGTLRPSVALNGEGGGQYSGLFELQLKQTLEQAGHIVRTKADRADIVLRYELTNLKHYPLRYTEANFPQQYHLRIDMELTTYRSGQKRTARTYRETRYRTTGGDAETTLDAVERLARKLSKDAVTFVNEGAVRMEHCCPEYPFPDEELPDPENLSGTDSHRTSATD